MIILLEISFYFYSLENIACFLAINLWRELAKNFAWKHSKRKIHELTNDTIILKATI